MTFSRSSRSLQLAPTSDSPAKPEVSGQQLVAEFCSLVHIASIPITDHYCGNSLLRVSPACRARAELQTWLQRALPPLTNTDCIPVETSSARSPPQAASLPKRCGQGPRARLGAARASFVAGSLGGCRGELGCARSQVPNSILSHCQPPLLGRQ